MAPPAKKVKLQEEKNVMKRKKDLTEGVDFVVYEFSRDENFTVKKRSRTEVLYEPTRVQIKPATIKKCELKQAKAQAKAVVSKEGRSYWAKLGSYYYKVAKLSFHGDNEVTMSWPPNPCHLAEMEDEEKEEENKWKRKYEEEKKKNEEWMKKYKEWKKREDEMKKKERVQSRDMEKLKNELKRTRSAPERDSNEEEEEGIRGAGEERGGDGQGNAVGREVAAPRDRRNAQADLDDPAVEVELPNGVGEENNAEEGDNEEEDDAHGEEEEDGEDEEEEEDSDVEFVGERNDYDRPAADELLDVFKQEDVQQVVYGHPIQVVQLDDE